VADIKSADLYLLRLDRTKEALLDAAVKAELKVAQLREVYIEASRERRVLDKLREKRFSEYRKNSAREEIKTLDDLSSGTRARQGAQDGI
jgi:flagellar FliJ protein